MREQQLEKEKEREKECEKEDGVKKIWVTQKLPIILGNLKVTYYDKEYKTPVFLSSSA